MRISSSTVPSIPMTPRQAGSQVRSGSTSTTLPRTDFWEKTFTSAELDSILESVVVSEDSSVYGTYGGGNTVDRVFLLSLEELTQFSTSADERVARHEGKTHYWWLRTPGEDMSRVTVVSPNGLVYRNGVEASDSHGVRPAMWVSLYKIQL